MQGKLLFGILALLFTFFTSPALAWKASDFQTLERAAEQGDASAQYLLGDRYYLGKGLPQNYAEALKWYRLAADEGHMMAQYLVGVMYANGEGVLRSYPEGYAWMSLVAARGDSDAEKLRDAYIQKMTISQAREARERTAALRERLQK